MSAIPLRVALLATLTASFAPSIASAQPMGDFSPGAVSPPAADTSPAPAQVPKYETIVRAHPSPRRTQDRVFPTTRFWLLDPGVYEVQVWATDQIFKGGAQTGVGIIKLQWGIAPHLQLDIYQNFSFNQDGWKGVEGNQIEMRYAPGYYNQIPLNPVLYVQWHPRHNQPDQGMIRVLLGGDLSPRLMWAGNLYYQTNIDSFAGHPYSQVGNISMGGTLAGTYALWDEHLRVGGEMLAGVDQHKTPSFHPALLAGPSAMAKFPGPNIKATLTVMFGTQPLDPRVYPQFLVAKQW